MKLRFFECLVVAIERVMDDTITGYRVTRGGASITYNSPTESMVQRDLTTF
jgi:hypothetical protein